MLTVGSLFTGIGGIDLGLERTGYFKTIWMVEIDEFCQKVLKKHWPGVPCYGDITKIDWANMPKVDVLCGGFPCQDISCANPRGKGLDGSRSGLWKEYAKAIRVLRPRYVLVENVPALARKGLNVVLADLAQAGYDAEWFSLRASDFGALHRRERVFIVAYNHRDGFDGQGIPILEGRPRQDSPRDKDGVAPHPHPIPRHEILSRQLDDEGCLVADRLQERVLRFWQGKVQRREGFSWCQDVRRVEDLSGRPDIPEPLFRGGRDGVSSRLYKSVIGRGKRQGSESVAEIDGIRRKILFNMWQIWGSPATSPRILRGELCGSVPDLPHEYPYETGYLGERIEKDEILRCLWQDILAAPFQETRDLQSRMLERIRETERLQALENGQWINRIKALGNAVVPDCAEFIGELTESFDRKRFIKTENGGC